MSLVLLLILFVLVSGKSSATVVFFPLILLPLLMVCLGLGWLLSSLGVFLRDIEQIVNVLQPRSCF